MPNEKEFGGTLGTFSLLISLPLVVTYICVADKFDYSVTQIPQISFLFELNPLTILKCFLMFLAWFIFQALLYLIPVGQLVKGSKLKDGSYLSYRINGYFALIVTHLFMLLFFLGKFDISYLYKYFVEFAISSIIFSFLLSFYLYFSSFRDGTILAEGGQTGSTIYDFFIGRELNPRVGSLDLKMFCELRPGLIGWLILDYSCLVHQYQSYGEISNSMYLLCFFHFLYVFDAIIYEESILGMMDIVFDGFGFMLTFGDLAFVPFTYTLQARFLATHPLDLNIFWIIIIALIGLIGYYIFRASNSIKNDFRKNPHSTEFKDLKTLTTQSGKKLIISGLWGMCRKPNYFGDLLMGLAWCMTCGITHILPYYYFVYFIVLLVHREMRDSTICRNKYGDDYEKYCKIIRYKIIPYVY